MKIRNRSKIRIVLTLCLLFIVLISYSVIDKAVLNNYLYKYINEDVLVFIRCTLFTLGVVDVLYLFAELISIFLNKLYYRTWKKTNENVRNKITNCSNAKSRANITNIGSTYVMESIISAYPNYDSENTNIFCEYLKNQFESQKDKISYFFIVNRTYKSIDSYISNNQSFFEECEKHSQGILFELLEFDFSQSNYTPDEFSKVLWGILHITLNNHILDDRYIEVIKNFVSWMQENAKSKFLGVSKEHLMLSLQVLSKIEYCLAKHRLHNNDKVGELLKNISKIKYSLGVKKTVNVMCNDICTRKIIDNMTIDEYARKTGLMTCFFDDIVFINKIRLCACLNWRNKRFKDMYYKATRITAVQLLLCSEPLVADFNPDDCFSNKLTTLLVAIADLMF